MKFSAYMFIRNGFLAGYTFMEAIENVLPFVDEFFILDGKSDDGTLEALQSFARCSDKIKIESELPQYVNAEKDERGLLLGQAFEDARQKCDGDWLVQVQADTVFHPITILASRYFLMQKDNFNKYDAINVIRHQYCWNWQEMHRNDYLNLIFKKSSGKVFGDAIDIEIKGKSSKKLLPLFNVFPATDNAWIFFENIMGKIEGSSEIWNFHDDNIINTDFGWYNKGTGRSFNKDLKAYSEKGALPPFWQTRTSPFKNKLPQNLSNLVGNKIYKVAPRFRDPKKIYNPDISDILAMIDKANILMSPLKQLGELWKLYQKSFKRRRH